MVNVKVPLVQEIQYSAFAFCKNLQTSSMSYCTSIDRYAFFNILDCGNLTFGGVQFLGDHAFEKCGTMYIVFSSTATVSIFTSNTFAQCKQLISITYPLSKITQIQENVFYNCNLLTKFIDNGGGTPNYFENCLSIGSSAFLFCYALRSIRLGKCNYIGKSAFANCSNLSLLYLYTSSVCTLGSSVFYGTPFSVSTYHGKFGSIYVPASLVSEYKAAPNWSEYSDRIVGM